MPDLYDKLLHACPAFATIDDACDDEHMVSLNAVRKLCPAGADGPDPIAWLSLTGKAFGDGACEADGDVGADFGPALSYLAACDPKASDILIDHAHEQNRTAMVLGKIVGEPEGPVAIPVLPELYDSCPAYRHYHDSIVALSWVDLIRLHELIGAEEAYITPEAYLAHRGDEVQSITLPDGRILGNELTGRDYLGMACFDYFMAESEVFFAAVKADPAKVAMEGGVIGGMFAQTEMIGRGMAVQEAKAALLAEVMEKVEDMTDKQAQDVILKTRRDLAATNPVVKTREELMAEDEDET